VNPSQQNFGGYQEQVSTPYALPIANQLEARMQPWKIIHWSSSFLDSSPTDRKKTTLLYISQAVIGTVAVLSSNS